MSEYQYYEFQAVDRSLTDAEREEISALSSRVNLSPWRAVFTYSYGDFRGDPEKLLAKSFDAMLYLANWGSRVAPAADLEPLLSSLTEAERLGFLRSLLRGETGVTTQLRLRLKEIASRQQPSAATNQPASRRRLSDLLQSAESIATGRAQQAEQVKEAARLKKLEGLAEKETRLWTQARGFVAQKNIKAYQEATGILKDLQELAKHRNQIDSFTARVQQLQQQYPGLSGLRSRLEGAGLLPKRL